MPEEHAKLHRFTQSVLKQAQQENDALSRRLEEQRAAAVEQARAEAREAARAHYDREAAHIRAEAGQEVSRHLMDIKRQVYLRRKEIGQEVFQRVRDRIAQFTADPQYPRQLEKLLAEALAQLPPAKSILLLLREEDMPLAPQLAACAAPLEVECQRGPFTLGGLTVLCPEHQLRLDCSFDTRLDELSGHFAEQFGLSLSEELDEL